MLFPGRHAPHVPVGLQVQVLRGKWGASHRGRPYSAGLSGLYCPQDPSLSASHPERGPVIVCMSPRTCTHADTQQDETATGPYSPKTDCSEGLVCPEGIGLQSCDVCILEDGQKVVEAWIHLFIQPILYLSSAWHPPATCSPEPHSDLAHLHAVQRQCSPGHARPLCPCRPWIGFRMGCEVPRRTAALPTPAQDP